MDKYRDVMIKVIVEDMEHCSTECQYFEGDECGDCAFSVRWHSTRQPGHSAAILSAACRKGSQSGTTVAFVLRNAVQTAPISWLCLLGESYAM